MRGNLLTIARQRLRSNRLQLFQCDARHLIDRDSGQVNVQIFMIAPIGADSCNVSLSDMFIFVLSVFSDLQYDEHIVSCTDSNMFHSLAGKGRD
jgi:hypothetical protein